MSLNFGDSGNPLLELSESKKKIIYRNRCSRKKFR